MRKPPGAALDRWVFPRLQVFGRTVGVADACRHFESGPRAVRCWLVYRWVAKRPYWIAESLAEFLSEFLVIWTSALRPLGRLLVMEMVETVIVPGG